MDERIRLLAEQLITEVGRETASGLLVDGNEANIKEVLERVLQLEGTGPQFRRHILLALRSELYGDQVSIRSVWELVRSREVLQTGCNSLDRVLGVDGGIPLGVGGNLLEFAGVAGSGKSQLSMQIALMACAPKEVGGLSASAVYISTEGRFPVQRLQQIEAGLKKDFIVQHGSEQIAADSWGERIYLEDCKHPENLLTLCTTKLPWMMEKCGARVVILDSVAAPFRSAEYTPKERQEKLLMLIDALKGVARQFRAIIVLTNQVSDIIMDSPADRNRAINLRGCASSPVPSLGLSWSFNVPQRFLILRKSSTSAVRDVQALGVAVLQRDPVIQFIVGEGGIRDVITN